MLQLATSLEATGDVKWNRFSVGREFHIVYVFEKGILIIAFTLAATWRHERTTPGLWRQQRLRAQVIDASSTHN